jgi:hypothetical protein
VFETDVQGIIISVMTLNKNKKNTARLPNLTKLVSERSGFKPLETNDDIVKLTKSMQLLETAIPASAKETHRIMSLVSERMLSECTSGSDPGKIEQAISSAVLTYSIIRDIYAGTGTALANVKTATGGTARREMMYESIVKQVRAPVTINESDNMKTVFGTIFKEIGEMQLEDFERIATTLPDFDIFLPKRILGQIAQKKLEQSKKMVSF